MHSRRKVQLSGVHFRTVRPTERSPRAQTPDAKNRGTGDNAVRLRHVESVRIPLRHATPNQPQLPDSLPRLAKKESHRPHDFVSGHPHKDEKSEHRGDYAQKVDPFRGIYGAHGGQETAPVRGAERTDGCHGLLGGGGGQDEY